MHRNATAVYMDFCHILMQRCHVLRANGTEALVVLLSWCHLGHTMCGAFVKAAHRLIEEMEGSI
jgi:hypothetical protein